MQEEQERTRVCVHRAGDVAEDDELSWDDLACSPCGLDRIPACAQRAADEPTQVEPVASRIRSTTAGRTTRPRARDRGHEDPAALELLGRHLGEVLLAEHFLLRGAELDGVGARIGLCGVATARQRALHEPVGLQALVLLATSGAAGPRRNHAANARSRLQLVVPGDERLAEREVDVLLAREVDCVEAAECVEHTPGPDLDPRLAEHAAERDHVADDR